MSGIKMSCILNLRCLSTCSRLKQLFFIFYSYKHTAKIIYLLHDIYWVGIKLTINAKCYEKENDIIMSRGYKSSGETCDKA